MKSSAKKVELASLNVGTYPLMDGKTITELAAPVKVEQDSITAFGCIDYPQPLTAEQEREYALLPASQNLRALDSIGHAAEAAQLPDAPEQALDEYPMPDPLLQEDDLKNCGYQDGDLLPLSKERALELFEQDLTVYTVVDGGGAEMLFDREEFESQLYDYNPEIGDIVVIEPYGGEPVQFTIMGIADGQKATDAAGYKPFALPIDLARQLYPDIENMETVWNVFTSEDTEALREELFPY